jgi:hypothetical protein
MKINQETEESYHVAQLASGFQGYSEDRSRPA